MGITQIEYKELVMEQGNNAIIEYSKWVSKFHWDWYAHFTFTKDIMEWKKGWYVSKYALQEVNKIDVEYVVKMFKRWRRIISQEIFGKHFREKGYGLSYALGIENESDNIHIHAVIGNNFGLDLNKIICRMCIKGLWEIIGLRTGICRIEAFDYAKFHKQKSIFYLCKHQIKQGNIRDFFVFPKGFELQGEWIYDKEKKRYIKIEDYYKYIHLIFPQSVRLVLTGCDYVWQRDLISGVWCALICKKFYEHRVKGDGMTGDGETCDSGEQGEQKSLFPQSPDSQSPRIE